MNRMDTLTPSRKCAGSRGGALLGLPEGRTAFPFRGSSAYLFPGRHGGATCAGPLRKQVGKAMFELIGLDFRPHMFRKMGPMIYLDRRPGEHDFVRRKLGHKSTRYTFSV